MIDLDHSTVDMFLIDPEAMPRLMMKSGKFRASEFGMCRLFHSEIGMFMYYMENHKPIAMCHARATKDKGFKIIKLEWAVLPEHRGKGLAKKVAEETIDQMAKWGIETCAPFDLVQADMEPDNKHSIKVAEDLGLESSYTYEHNKIKYLTYGDIICYE